MKLITLCLLFFFQSPSVNGEVWKATGVWNEYYEDKYSAWIRDHFKDDIFSNPDSPYYGIKTDCADALLVARAIFSYENELSFSFKNVDGDYVSEKSTAFDYLPFEKKFITFANSLADQISVHQLASENTVYIHPEKIRAGDYYLVRWLNKEGKINHHAYIIKSILPTGDFEFLSSTTPKAARTLSTRLGMPVQFFSGEPFGFKRFKEKKSSFALVEDKTQLLWISKGENEFYSRVKKILQTEEDSYSKNFNRRFFNICQALKLRTEVVSASRQRIKEKNGRCLKGPEYDEFSTYSRDQNIQREFERIINGWKTIIAKKIDHGLSTEDTLGLNFLIGREESIEGKTALDRRCRIHFKDDDDINQAMGLRTFYHLLKSGAIISDPNQSAKTRFGLAPKSLYCH